MKVEINGRTVICAACMDRMFPCGKSTDDDGMLHLVRRPLTISQIREAMRALEGEKVTLTGRFGSPPE